MKECPSCKMYNMDAMPICLHCKKVFPVDESSAEFKDYIALKMEDDRLQKIEEKKKERKENKKLAAIGLVAGTLMILWPDLSILSDEDVKGGGLAFKKLIGLIKIIDFIWSRPLGIFMAFCGAFLVFDMVVFKKGDDVELE